MERSTCDRRKVEGKKGSESRYVEREVNNKYDDRKKRGRKERNNKESGKGKVNDQVDAKRRSYSEAGALRTERVFMGDSILRRKDKIVAEKLISSKGERLFRTTNYNPKMVAKKIMYMKDNKSPGVHGIPPKLILKIVE